MIAKNRIPGSEGRRRETVHTSVRFFEGALGLVILPIGCARRNEHISFSLFSIGPERRVRILFTTRNVAWIGGIQLYIRDIARGLLKRGHEPVVYCAIYDEELDRIRAWGIPVVDDLECVAVPPDVVHGNDVLGLLTALIRWPDTPGIFTSHGWTIDDGVPPAIDRILRYVAVDEACLDRLVKENGIPPEKTAMIQNFVDLDRFERRPPLPSVPKRALLFGNGFRYGASMQVVREACRRREIDLDVLGAGVSEVDERPEGALGRYDLVFARGRCALEAMATGCAVVLQGFDRIGGMVTPDDLDRLRRQNFGVRALDSELTAAVVAEAIARYDRDRSREVCETIRSTASLPDGVEQVEELCREVIEQFQGMRPFDSDTERKQIAECLRRLDVRYNRRKQPPAWIVERPGLRKTIRWVRRLLRLY